MLMEMLDRKVDKKQRSAINMRLFRLNCKRKSTRMGALNQRLGIP